MFEAHVLHLLRRYLGEYVHGLSAEALRISVWKGDVVLRDLKLKAEALNSLKLPVIVKAGFVGTITLKVPWKSLGKEPVIVLIDRVFVLAQPAPDGRTLTEEDREKLFEAKLRQIEEAECTILEAKTRATLGSPSAGNSWLGSLIATVIGNLKISISNVHIRYEDSISNPGHPFSSGITLAKLAAVTMDEQGNETFDTSGALDRLRKSLQLERLALYHDSDNAPWKVDKNWEDLSPKQWIEIFEDGINEPTTDHGLVSLWALNRQYLVSPINGVLKYHRLGNQERKDPETPFEKVSLILSDVSFTITESQYHDGIKLMEAVSRYKTYVDVSHLRPMVPILDDPRAWWLYAAQAGVQQKQMCYRFSWDRIRHMCQLRRHYIQLYAGSLQHLSSVDSAEIRKIEKDLDSKVILLWRLLAHAKVESVKLKEAAEHRSQTRRSWFSFRWRASPEDASAENTSKGSELEEKLTKEEWQAINKLLSYQPDEDFSYHLGKEMQNVIRFLVNVSISQAAARIISIDQIEIICGRFEQLHVTTKLYHRSTHCDVSLRFYGLSAPEGSLAQSVSSEQKVNALAASFVHSPVGENVDWRLSAAVAPCHVTVLLESYDRFSEFMRRSNAISPTVALETATALQMKLEKVTRRAQEQFQMVLEEQSRFSLDIDIDAPKVRIPMRACTSSEYDGHFLLDLGHFTLHTEDGQCDEKRQSLYSRFYITGRDIAAFFMDCGSDSGKCVVVDSDLNAQTFATLASEIANHFYPLVDRCGMAVIVDQIKVPHPSYPLTRVSVQVPNLGIHFSPARYCRLLELLNMFYGTMGNTVQPTIETYSTDLAPWSPVDLATEARILVWRGIGNSVAEWQSCFLVLSGLYLYVLESEMSQSYQRCSSMAGRQVYEVPPTSVGGSMFSIAVSFRGMDIQKALESSSTLILEFRDEEEKNTWLKGLVKATYKASAPPSVDGLGESNDAISQSAVAQATNLKTVDLVINGALVETKLFVYGKTGEVEHAELEETLILEILAVGGKLHLVHGGGDMTVKMKLHSLKIGDELQGRLSMSQQYLACSVLKSDSEGASQNKLDRTVKEFLLLEEEDSFKDALPDFMSLPDMGKGIGGEVFYEAHGNDTSDFVSVNFSTKNSGSPGYDGVDTQMSIRMSKLEFFCNRPTLVALIRLGLDLSAATSGMSNEKKVNGPDAESSRNREKTDENGRAYVKGLLGYGKSRVVFYLHMDVGSVCVFLNKEDHTQLAMFVQESFLLDLKVHPSSLSIEGTLGNFRLRDMSLGVDHCWGWLCDIRNQEVESLIKFKFESYSAEDDDYGGYDYSLFGRLSAVRIVFLYRFVQEITAYFMELATPHTEEAIKLGGFEGLILKYEIDGASAIKLDLSLDTPIIIIPRNSTSKDFIQLDLGLLQVRNEFRWHGCAEKDPSAVHLDVLHAEILGINMAIGINGVVGKPMIREGQGLHVYVCRSLRDVFRKVPTFSVDIKVGLLHCVMSSREYNIILDCVYMNIYEEARIPPSFRGTSSVPKDTMRMLADKVNFSSQVFLSRTVTIFAVDVSYALLELCNGTDEESPLAQVALEGLWVSYRMTSFSETDLYVTIPRFSILDIRPDTKPEMRLMLGSSSVVSESVPTGNIPISLSNSDSTRRQAGAASDIPNLTMLLMDYRMRSSSQSFVVRVQQPRVLVVLDFVLAVCEFFVPALGAMTGREELSDPKNDPITRTNSIVLSETMYKQQEDMVHLSPSRKLIADAVGIDEYTYDGCGGTIYLSEENDTKETHCPGFEPIIVIGRGKKLRFVNVKIENGSLLRKYTYLSNDSSYAVSVDDGVDISLLESFTSDSDRMSLDYMHESSDTSVASHHLTESDSSKMQSFTFEAQVVSPEFTFYDSTKSSLDDSVHGEKLLRAKLDLSFMYASKENDTWIRTLIKDLTVEAGSGLIILDPVDISGGYTSVKDKTSISLISTDICTRLSLSAISLVLNLQSQAAEALQFGNADPVASCTNFDRLWVSPEENGPGYNLTFWRPQAPSNYVILGDCVTSRPIPPSQAVMAASNTYGRVRKPLGFKLVGLFSCIQGVEGDTDTYNSDSDCSLWIPVAPPGYTALGCVAHIGSEAPPNHVVYCMRSDLVTSTTYSECIFTVLSSARLLSGFSIWRIDNVIGSFYAHPATDCPSRNSSCDLGHILLWNSSHLHDFSGNSGLYFSVDNDCISQQGSNQSAAYSGWDILRSGSRASNCYMTTPHFERIWWDKGSDLQRPISIWRPIPRPGFAALGDCITEGLEPPALGIIFKADHPEISAKPVQFTKVAHIARKGLEAYFWYPIAPPGYVSLGCVVSRNEESPCMDSFCCPRMDLVHQANIMDVPISRFSSSKASNCWSIWKVENQACTFLARSDLKKPSSRLAYNIGDSVKPKTQENISAEMKLRSFSATILDSLCGTMTPLFDMTITNMKLVTHGRVEAMNAVLISSIAASSFNTQLEAWEPLVEPFDGIFKFETYSTNMHSPSRLGKRLRVAATNILNLNISAANLETFAETVVSWRRQIELEQKSKRLQEEPGNHCKHGGRSTFSALDEDDFQTVIVENKLGCDIYLKKAEQNSDLVEMLHPGSCASAWIPPPRFSDRLNIAEGSMETRSYVAIQIIECRGLPIMDDGNSHNFFCALRLIIDSLTADHQKLFPQSARTKCVKPSIFKTNDKDEGTAKWNELFIFEVPRKGVTKLELEVTNLAAKAGKGEVVGASSISIEHGLSMLKKVASMKMLHQSSDVQNVVSYPLRRRDHVNTDADMFQYGCLLVSTSYFERKTILNCQKETETASEIDRETGFWLRLGPEGPWEAFRSLLPFSVVPRILNNDYLAMEVVMKNGKKHVILRGLATVVNDSDIKLDLCVCPVTMLSSNALSTSGTHSSNIVIEEVFQNQRYQTISGWGNRWPGFHGSDSCHWSTRDFSFSSKDFFEPSIPPGWKWTSTWTIDKSQFVDNDGWAYGPDYRSLKWPPTSPQSCSKSAQDFVRRRRWFRPRQQIIEGNLSSTKKVVEIVSPECSSVLPWRSMARDSDWCLQVRPSVVYPEAPYSWGQAIAACSGYAFGNDQSSVEQGSLSRQNTMRQGNTIASFGFKLNQLENKDIILYCCQNTRSKGYYWLSVGTDASVLHTELNAPVYDWKISVNSPLKLENRLPCQAEFTIWERTNEGKYVERQHGIISSRRSVHVYSADIQKPIYLTLFAQGGWVLEKDPVLVLDISSLDHVSSFWMVHQQSKRRLRVSIERDMGGTSAAPKTIRIFVPYWIKNDSSLSLAYRLVEIESLDNSETRAVKSAKTAFINPMDSNDRRNIGSRKNIRILEVIEDSTPTPSMLSPLDHVGRSGVVPFSSQNDAYLSPRIGIAVAIRHSDCYGPGISLLELENKERLEVKVFGSDGSYYKLSTLLNTTSDRTKVVHFQPQTLFINRICDSICLQQCDTQAFAWIQPTDPPKPFKWHSSSKVELLKLRIDGYEWSTPFSIENEGLMRTSLKSEMGTAQIYIKIEVRSGTKSSCYEVIFRPDSLSSPYRVENRSMFLPIHFRQIDGTIDSWQCILPSSAASYFWEDLGRQHLLEVLVDGTHPIKSEKYNIDEISDHQPIHVTGGPTRALRVTIIKEGKMNVIKISDWMPESELSAITAQNIPSFSQLSTSDSQQEKSFSTSDSEFHVIFEIAELGISIIDHTPEEILYLSVQNLLLSYSTGLGSGISRFKLWMRGIQVDNQLPLTPMPVLFRPQRVGEEIDFILKLSLTLQSNGSLDFCVYPYIGFHGPENCAFLIKIHEPIIWRLHEMIQQANVKRSSETQTTAVPFDPVIQIGVLNISEIRFKVSMAMSPSQRPRGVLGFWSSLMTALGNTENMPVKINQRFHEDICMRQSALISSAISNIQKDLLSQPLQLLSGVDILGNASSALGHMSKGVAALSMDKKFIQSRQRQENKGVEDIGDVIREGGGALAKGLFRGVTGILTKPLEGAKTSGVEGFVQGVGKGLIGAAAQPVSGVLDLLSKTTEGANAVRMKIASALTSEEQLLRRRLPRAISGDNLLHPYDECKAQGQVILQLAESGSFFSQVDLFKVRGKFALSDAYEDHFSLPKGKILVVTHRRVILLQQPSNIIAQRKFSPAKDPCSVSWDVSWDDLGTMELTNGKSDKPGAPPSRIILYLHARAADSREHIRVIKCSPDSPQALQVYSSIEQSMNTYGPNKSKDMQKKKVTRPYSPSTDGTFAELIPREGVSGWTPQHVPAPAPARSTFGSNTT